MEKKQTMQSLAYDALRSGILNLVLEPGRVIDQQEIANQLKISRTPVREALIYLSKEGMVRIQPQRGTVVTQIDPSRVRQERFMRESLEEAVMEMFKPSRVELLRQRMEALIGQQEGALAQEDFVAFRRLDDAFHAIFYADIRQSLSWEALWQINTHYSRLRLLSLNRTSAGELIQEHRDMLAKICEGDTVHTKQLLHAHLHRMDDEIAGLMEGFPTYFVSQQRRPNPLDLC